MLRRMIDDGNRENKLILAQVWLWLEEADLVVAPINNFRFVVHEFGITD